MFDPYGRWFPDYPGQTIYNDPMYQTRASYQTSPTPAGVMAKKVDLIQIGSEQEAGNYPAGAMLITKDEGTIIFKGNDGLSAYDLRPPAPPEKPFDPGEYVRKDEIRQIIDDMMKGGAA